MKILVVGATGAMGRPAVRQLRARGIEVRAFSRHADRAGDLAALGAELMAGDLVDAASLQRACSGVERVLVCAHGLMGRGAHRSERVDDAGHRALIEAAKAAKLQRFVYTSAHGARADHPIDFFRTKHTIEQALAASGLDAVVLRPTAFMEHHAHHFNGKGLLEKGQVRLIGPGTKLRNFVCAADVAKFALRALLEDPPPYRTLVIGGRGHYSALDVAALYARTAGLPLRVSHLPAVVAGAIGFVARPWHPGLARLMHLLSLPDDAFEERFDGHEALQRETGIGVRTLEEFVREQVVLAGLTPRTA